MTDKLLNQNMGFYTNTEKLNKLKENGKLKIVDSIKFKFIENLTWNLDK